MKKISVMIPCYNEEENVREIAAAVKEVLERDLPNSFSAKSSLE